MMDASKLMALRDARGSIKSLIADLESRVGTVETVGVNLTLAKALAELEALERFCRG